MKQNKFIIMCYFLLIAALIEYMSELNVYIMLILMVIAFAVLWMYLEQNEKHIRLKENIELQEEVKSTAKDAHLKNKQLSAIVGSIPFPMILLDQFGHIVMHNNVSELIEDELTTEMTYVSNPFVRSVKDFMKDAFILEKRMDKIIKIGKVEYQGVSVPVTAKQKYSGCLVLFQDISKALEGEKMQKRFIADASHELKTPISVIKGMVEILNRDDFDDDVTRTEFLTQIESEINRLDVLVKDLLQLSRLSASHTVLERKKTDMREMIKKTVVSLEKEAQRKHLTIKLDFQTNEALFCDPMKMQQVIINLLSNAIKYSDEGTITITTKLESQHYLIMVKDEGCGLSKEAKEKIFERFYRVDDDRSRKSGGSGLGLSIVKRIVEAHHGKIIVESDGEHGSCFIVKLKN